MAKGKKKKKKDVDFQKVKLKVGRKLKRDSNETKAEFKAKRIVIREARLSKTDPLTMLVNRGDNMSQNSKVLLLSQLTAMLSGKIVKSLSKPIIDAIAKFLIDHSESVRVAANRCVKSCFNHLRQLRVPAREFVDSLRPYLNCAYTHISTAIQADCRSLLNHFVLSNDPTIHDLLISILLRRLEAGKLSLKDYKLARLLGNSVKRRRAKIQHQSSEDDKIQPLKWSDDNIYLNLRELIELDHRVDGVHEIFLSPTHERCDDIESRYFAILEAHPDLEKYEEG